MHGLMVNFTSLRCLLQGLRWQQQYSDSLEQYYNATLGTLTTAQASSSHWWLFMQWQLVQQRSSVAAAARLLRLDAPPF